MAQKKFISYIIAGLLILTPLCAVAKPNYSYTTPASNVKSVSYSKALNKDVSEGDVLQGSISVDITPYCQNWTSVDAFNIINHIGAKLITSNGIDKKIQFTVTEKEEANASTDINNKIEIYKGLLKYVETEDELAFVIGHEMGHITKNDVKKSIIRRSVLITTAVTGSVLSIIGGYRGSDKMKAIGSITAASTVAGDVTNQKLSRGQEIRADLSSIDFIVNAGYNPLAAISILNKISGNYFDFFSDHPSGEKRIKKAYKYISKKYPEYIEKGYNSTSYERALKIINGD